MHIRKEGTAGTGLGVRLDLGQPGTCSVDTLGS